ncbi:MAG TPA: YihY/virulence factor BrkB family protein [Caulobacteraceae bacterium]
MTARSDPVKAKRGRAWGRAGLALRIAPWLALGFMAALWPRSPRTNSEEVEPSSAEELDAAEPGRGRMANAPWEIPALGWKDILWRTYRNVGRDGLPSVAGGVTFYLLLATFPAVTAFVSVYGLFLDPATVEKLLYHWSAILPNDALELIGDQMIRLGAQRHEVLSAAFAVSTLISVWSANAGMKALLVGLNVAYDEYEKRPYLRRTLFTYTVTLSAVTVLSTITMLTVAAPVLLAALGLREFHVPFAPLRWLLVYLIGAFALTLVYRYGPSRRRPKWRWVAFGGAVAALVWIPGSLGFSFYVDNFTHLGATYGSLGAVIGFMLWVWFTVMVVLVGAELNAAVEHQTACDTTRGPWKPMGRRGANVADTVGRPFTVSPHEAADMAEDYAKRQIGILSRWLGL